MTLTTVVIPTLGRPTLARAIQAALDQDSPVEVIVVNDSGKPLALSSQTCTVRVIDTPGKIGAAAARNIGMAFASGDLIAFCDDDDVWLQGHLSDAIAVFTRLPEISIYCAHALVVNDLGFGRIEPVDPLRNRTVAEYFFGRSAWRSRCRRIATSTIVFRSPLATLPMDENLTSSEDTWWLLTAESVRGATVYQSKHIGAIFRSSVQRDASRAALRDETKWAWRLNQLAPGSGPGHLAFEGRSAAKAGEPAEVLRLGKEALAFPGGWRYAPVLAIELGVGWAVALRLRSRHG